MRTQHYPCSFFSRRSTGFFGRACFISALFVGLAASASAQIAPAVAVPIFTPKSGEYGTGFSVSISTTTPGALIRYTVDGMTLPTETVGTLYSGPIPIKQTTRFRAIAYKKGLRDSQVRFAAYVIGPNFSVSVTPEGQELIAGQSATFTVTVTPKFGFNDTVQLGVFDPPQGVTVTLQPTAITGSGTAKLVVKTSAVNTISGNNGFYVEGEGDGLTHAAFLALEVDAAPWAAGKQYPQGVSVTYQGHTYTALQANFSYASGPPPSLPQIWNFNF